MSPPPTIYTPPSELDGTVTGMILTAVVAALALALLIGLVYWANSHPEVRRPQAQQPGSPEIPGREPLRASAAPSPAQAPEAADSRWSIQPSKEDR
jgi:hypothetical protein